MRRDSVAYLRFDLEREIGYFILYIYFPLNLVVGCSWVAFWIVKTDVNYSRQIFLAGWAGTDEVLVSGMLPSSAC